MSVADEAGSTSSDGRRRGQRAAAASESALKALEASSVGRMRVLAFSMVLLAGIGFAIATVLDADPVTRRLAQGSLAFLAAGYVFVALRTGRAPRLDEQRHIVVVALPICVAVVLANFAFGLLSPFGIAVAVGLLLFSSSTERATASLAFSAVGAGFVLCAVVRHFGWYAHAPYMDFRFSAQWMWDLVTAVVGLLYTAAFVAGRLIRSEHARAVANFENAVREAWVREALLREAREAFKQAAGIGAPGRFTDQEIEGFKLGAVIGRGGMGEVYAAERLEDGRDAAVKLLRMDALVERSALARFEREARMIAAIQSPNVVKVLAVSHADSVLPYIAMERLRGVDLASYLRDCGRLSLIEVVDLVSQVAVGLTAAHAANVVHRDLKPNNVFRCAPSERPIWKILDFGVSKWMDAGDPTLTAAELVGTPQYMAPEQARGDRQIDQRADVYALAAVAYRALTGEAPFGGKLPSLLKQITDEMPRAPSRFVDLPPAVDQVLAIGLAKAPPQRFQTAIELSAALTLAAGNHLGPELTERAKGILSATPYAR